MHAPTGPAILPLLESWLAARLGADAQAWLAAARAELAAGASDERFCVLLSSASRHIARGMLAPKPEERCKAWGAVEGLDPERWTLLEAARVRLVLAHPELANERGQRALEEAFRYTDVGEACALYRSLAHVPVPERFAWRVGEGCRSSMQAVYEAAATDTPYPFRHFDPIAWRQCVIKGLFVGAALPRIFGLDQRLDAELARMALDLADERRSAGRPVPIDLWLCLGPHGGERGRSALEHELVHGAANARMAAG
ncbi:MAG: hypothetical protein FJ299_16725, partial [Planctomycetes bacterium]|nr:hypothetical protein [Planctomycetota bacterium]